MEQSRAVDDEELRAQLENLRQELEAGRVHIAPGLPIVDSLKAVKHGADGRVDLSSVDGRVRALANAVSFATYRREAKGAVSLKDLQQSYFTYMERSFGELYAEMKKRKSDPARVASAIAASADAVKDFAEGMPQFLELIDDLWKTTWDSSYYHIQDLAGLKAIFGGETFPSARKNILSSAGVYTDTIILPDPFLRTKFTQNHGEAASVRWFVKSALSLLNYREAAMADVQLPLVVVAPDASHVDTEEQKQLLEVANPSVLRHLNALFGAQFETIDDAEHFLEPLATPKEVFAKLKDSRRLLFQEGDRSPLEEQLQDYMDTYFSPFFEGGAGIAVLFNITGRMRQATDILLRSSTLGGTPLIDAPTSWRYFTWKLSYDAQVAPGTSGRHLHMARALQNASQTDMQWLGNVPLEALIEMRKQDALPELRSILAKGVQELIELRPDNFYRTGDQVVKNIQDAFEDHRKKLSTLTGKKWRFAGVELGSCIVKGAVQIASAFGVPGVSLIGAAIDQATDVPKLKDLPKRARALREDHIALKSSSVGLLFAASERG